MKEQRPKNMIGLKERPEQAETEKKEHHVESTSNACSILEARESDVLGCTLPDNKNTNSRRIKDFKTAQVPDR